MCLAETSCSCGCLSTVTTQIRPAVGASVVHVHAVVNATRYQTTSQPATVIKKDSLLDRPEGTHGRRRAESVLPKQCNYNTGQIGNHAGLSACRWLNLCVARWTYHMCRGATNGYHCCQYVCAHGSWRCNRRIGSHWLHSANSLQIRWRGRWWWNVCERWRIPRGLAHVVSDSWLNARAYKGCEW